MVWQPLFVCIPLLNILLVTFYCCCWFQGEGKEGNGLVASAGKLELKINLRLAPGATENCHVGLLRGIAQYSHHSPENLPSLWFDHFSNEIFCSCEICYFPPPQNYLLGTFASPDVGSWPGPKKWILHHSLLDCRERDQNMDEGKFYLALILSKKKILSHFYISFW